MTSQQRATRRNFIKGAAAAAAANALGKIGGRQATTALNRAKANAPPQLKAALHDAWLRCTADIGLTL